ncbi:hypothetical protein [Hymenobacter fodinae]|uniref:Uncharacterized protein n=1 Tax=Hymenobacter fodinae TaxID=2510796 RepID=A0A4Z0P0U4_9BACT|nr:hypothetical protein [Hymenobacter fodinae]TGE04874.1 hypothetical protein EU556_22105 [Hymenobacter fodinae]
MLLLIRTNIAALALLLTSCAVPANIPRTSANPFGGAAGTLLTVPATKLGPGRKLALGPYQVSDVHRDWTTTRTRDLGYLRPGTTGSPVLDILHLPYVHRVSTADSKMEFHLANSQDPQQAADVYCSRQALTQSVVSKEPLLGEIDPELRSRTTETFNAIIVGPQLGQTNAWNLLMTTTNKTGFERDNQTPVIGLVGDADQVLLRIRLVARAPLPESAGKLAHQVIHLAGPGGIEILHDGQRICFLDFETISPDQVLHVWVRDGIDPNLRLLTSATIATLLMRNGEL